MEEKLDLMMEMLTGLCKDMASLKSRVDFLESNQLTFLTELREMRLEMHTRDRWLMQELEELRNQDRFIFSRVSAIELDVESLKFKAGSPET